MGTIRSWMRRHPNATTALALVTVPLWAPLLLAGIFVGFLFALTRDVIEHVLDDASDDYGRED